MNTNNQIQKEALFLGLISVCAFALTLPLSKVVVSTLSGYSVGILRSLIAAFFAIFIIYFTKSKFPKKTHVTQLYLTSVGIVYGFPILTALGMETVPVGHGAVVLALLPISTAIWGSFLTQKNMPAKFWLYSILGLSLVFLYILLRYDLEGFYYGDLYLAGAVILAGFGYAQGGKLSSELKGWEVICWMLILNIPLLILIAFLIVPISQLTILNNYQIAALLFLALVNSLLGFFSWNKALSLGGIQKISQLQLLQPFITYLYSIFLMGEKFDLLTVVICGLVVAMIVKIQNAHSIDSKTYRQARSS